MNRPTEEEIKGYFKNADTVRCIVDGKDYKLDLSQKITEGSYGTDCKKQLMTNKKKLNDVLLWSFKEGYAEILTYKEKTFSITESQIKTLYDIFEVSEAYQGQDYLKEWFPESEAFESEVKFEVGKWYIEKTDLSNGFRIIFAKEVIESVIKGYGLDGYGEWGEKLSYGFGDFIEATEQEVFEALKNEAVKRGYKDGTWLKKSGINKINDQELKICGEFEYYPFSNILYCQEGNGYIFEKGQWAEIIETITLSEAEQQLGKKIIV